MSITIWLQFANFPSKAPAFSSASPDRVYLSPGPVDGGELAMSRLFFAAGLRDRPY
jgi:hypothetical protein